jgi:hypothetical protein
MPKTRSKAELVVTPRCANDANMKKVQISFVLDLALRALDLGDVSVRLR